MYREDGPPPPVDLAAERRNGDFVRGEILAGRVSACHDLSDGGLLVALAEMAMAGGIGATIEVGDCGETGWLFGEDQARYLMAVPAAGAAAMLNAAKSAGVPAKAVGQTGGASLTVCSRGTISLERLEKAHESWLPDYMNGKAA